MSVMPDIPWFASNRLLKLVKRVYGVMLFFMAISGMFILRGKKGLGGRGKWLVAVGILVPTLFLLLGR